MAIEQQMQLFALGGLDDDGMSRDPVSGNTIPAGSMANEVRDDVDAKLSDGEYVVPANVVRFFGVKFFEDLRTQAMQGLGTMEANGRIGGEPMPSAMPMQDQMANSSEELSEQDMAMLQNIMNEGGDVRGYVHGGYHDPVNDPQPIPQSIPSSVYPLTQYATPGASTMNPALNTNVPITPANTPNIPTPPVVDPNAGTGSKLVTMVNPATGEIQVVQFYGDVPVDEAAYNNLISNGFFIQGSPELAQYKQKQAQDNRESDEQMGGDKPKTVEDLLQSTLYGSINLGPSGQILGGVIDNAFPTTSNQDVIDYIIDKGEFPPSGRGLRDTSQPRMGNGEYPFQYHTEGPLTGTIIRDNSSPRNVAKEKVAYLKEAMRLQKQNTNKKGKINYKNYRNSLIKNGQLIKSGLTTKTVSWKDWYKDWDGKTKTKTYEPPTLTVGSAEDLANRRLGVRDPSGTKFTNYEYDAEGNNLTVKGRKDLLDDVETRYKDVLPKGLGSRLTPKEVDDAIKSSAPTTVDSDFSNDNNNNNDNENNTASSSNPNVGNVDTTVDSFENTAGGKYMNKGGLLKKPTKKKTKKTKK
jgi:hypothetical protein